MRGYLRVLGHEPLGALLATSVLARLALSITPLGLVLFISAETGSYAIAGAVAGGSAVGMGLGSPLLGRVIDRHGLAVLLPAAGAHAAGLGAVVGLAGEAPAPLLVLVAIVTGGVFPPVHSVIRARIPALLGETRELVGSAYALEAVIVEVAFVGGPLLAGATIALLAPAAALAMSGVSVVVGTALFVRLSPRTTRESAAPAGGLGALRSPGVATVTAVMLPFGFAIGTLEVTLPAFSEQHGAPELAGVLLAAWALGSLVGGLVYGARQWPRSVAEIHLACSLLFPLTFLPLVAAPSVAVMAVIVVPAGLVLAPLFASRNELVGAAALPGTETEALTWPVTALLVGMSCGAALSGVLIDATSWRVAVVAAAAVALVGALVSAARRTTLDGLSGRGWPAPGHAAR